MYYENEGRWEWVSMGCVTLSQADAKEAAVHLMMEVWEDEYEDEYLDHFHWINSTAFCRSRSGERLEAGCGMSTIGSLKRRCGFEALTPPQQLPQRLHHRKGPPDPRRRAAWSGR